MSATDATPATDVTVATLDANTTGATTYTDQPQIRVFSQF